MIRDFLLLYDMLLFDISWTPFSRRLASLDDVLTGLRRRVLLLMVFQSSALPLGSRFGASPHSEAREQPHPPYALIRLIHLGQLFCFIFRSFCSGSATPPLKTKT